MKTKNKPSKTMNRGASRQRDNIIKKLNRMIAEAERRPHWGPKLPLMQFKSWLLGCAYRNSKRKGGLGVR
jgi:hypothetical protein